jgi:phage-related protein
VNQTADDTVSIWNIIWNNTIGRAIRGWQDLVRIYHEGINLVMIPVHEALRRFAGWWRENGDEVKQVWHELWAELVAMVRPFIAAFVVIIRGGLYLVKTIFDNVTREIRDVWHFFLGSMRQSLSAFTENMTALWRSWTSTISRIWNFLWGSLLKTIHEYVSLVKAEWNFFAGSFMKSFHEFLTAVVDSWKYTWGIVRTLAHSAWGAIMTLIKTSWDIIVGFITVGLDLLTGHWRKAWNDIKNIVIQVWHNIRDYFAGAGHWLVQAGTDIIQGLLNGMKSAVTGIGSWIKGNIVDPIVNAVKHFFGIHSPAASMVPLGSSLIMGLIKGMLTSAKDMGKFIGSIFGGWPEALAHLIEKSFVDIGKLPAKAIHALAGVAGKIGGFVSNVFRGGPAGAGVERWLPTIKVALMLNNLPDSFAGQVAYQMQTESGGNPNAINLWDINAQRGDPSKGLMQVIGSTFAAYHIPGTSNNIYDPLANIAAAINYAKHVYGPTLGALGSGHGYDQGGWLPPGASLAYNLTGRPELVLTHEQMIGLSRGGDGGTQYIAHFDSLTGAAIESHVRTAYQAMSMTQGNLNRQGRRR